MRLVFCLIFLIISSCQLDLVSRPSLHNRIPQGDLYTNDIELERLNPFHEVILVLPSISVEPQGTPFLTATLSADFKEQYLLRYQSQWSHSEVNQLEMFTAYNRRVIEESARRREFADYMVKKLLEFHVDNFVKSDPVMRPIYEAKEKLQNVEVKVNKSIKLNLKYSLAGNIFDFELENPYFVEAKVTFRMDPQAFGPTTPFATEYRLTRKMDARRRVQWLYQSQIQTLSTFVLQDLTPQLNQFYGFSFSNYSGSVVEQSWSNGAVNQMGQMGQMGQMEMDPFRLSAGIGWRF